MQKKMGNVLIGAGISLVVPLGWFCINLSSTLPQHGNQLPVYVYLLATSLFICAFSGYLIGTYQDKVKRASFSDALTGLYNNSYFHMRLEQEISKAHRSQDSLTVINFNIDKLKIHNEQYGRKNGDKIITAVGLALYNVIRQGETLARVGGKGFAIIIPKCTQDNAEEIKKRMQTAVKDRTITLDATTTINVSLSAGAATSSDADQLGPDMLYALAEKARIKDTSEN